MAAENWKDIPGYEGYYQVSDLGRVKSLERKVKTFRASRIKKEKILSSHNHQGYECIQLVNKNAKRRGFRIHQLVAMAFLNHKTSAKSRVVDHINGIKNDNRVSNLQVISQRKNVLKGSRERCSSNYYGCHKIRDKWRSTITIKGKSTYLGTFETPIEAHNAYKKAMSEI